MPRALSPPRVSFDAYYAGTLGGRVFRWLDWAKIRLVQRVLGERRPGGRVLDLGCGSGAVAAALRLRSPDHWFLGLDHDPALARAARGRGVCAAVADFDQPLPIAAGQVDVAIMVDTIEHCESPRSVVAELRRLLAPDGVLIVFTPPYDTFAWLVGEKLHHLVTRRPADHISPFTRESLAYLLRSNFENWRVGTLNLGLTMYGVASGVRVL